MWSLLQIGTALAVLITIGALLWRFPVQTAMFSVGGALMTDCFDIGRDGITLGISIYVDDIVCAILLLAGCAVIVRWREFPPRNFWIVFALFALAILNMVRGSGEFGTKAAGNGIRGLVYLLVPAIAFMLLRPALNLDATRLARLLGLVGLVFGVVALCRWAGVLPSPEWSAMDNLRETPRVLNAEYAMVVGEDLIATLFLQLALGFSWWRASILGVLAGVLLFLQHRSVWSAIAVALILLATRTIRLSGRQWAGVATGGVIALVIWAAVMPNAADSVSTLLGTNLQETEGSGSTWEWRTKGFEEAVYRTFSGTSQEMLIGPPAGRNLGSAASFASVYIHDRYVDTLAYYGVFGEILLLLWLISVCKAVLRRPTVKQVTNREYKVGRVFLQALLAAHLIYFVPYTGGLPLGAVIGLVWAVSMKRPTKQRFGRFSFAKHEVTIDAGGGETMFGPGTPGITAIQAH